MVRNPNNSMETLTVTITTLIMVIVLVMQLRCPLFLVYQASAKEGMIHYTLMIINYNNLLTLVGTEVTVWDTLITIYNLIIT